MARHTGYGGTITFTTTTTSTAIEAEIQRWDLSLEQAEWESYAKSDDFKDFQFGRKTWQAICVFLVDTGVLTTDHTLIGVKVEALILNYDGSDKWTAQVDGGGTNVGQITNVSVSSPLDGPVEITVTIRGIAVAGITFG